MTHRSSLIIIALTLTMAAIVVAQSRPSAASGPSGDDAATSQPASKPATPREQSVANLRRIAMMLELHQMEHKNSKVPTMEQLTKEFDLDASTTTSPVTGQPYKLTGWPVTGPDGKQEHVVVFETGNDAGNLAVCNDLSIVRLKPDQLKEIMAPAK